MGSTSVLQSISPVETAAWKDLRSHYDKIHNVHLRTLFADDPSRGERLTAEALGLFLDYSKNRITGETLALLIRLAIVQDRRLRCRLRTVGVK